LYLSRIEKSGILSYSIPNSCSETSIIYQQTSIMTCYDASSPSGFSGRVQGAL
jgi:hypothetical protein